MNEHNFVCDRCKNKDWHFDKAAGAFVYGDEVVRLVLRLKYNAEGDIARAVAPFMVGSYHLNLEPNFKKDVKIIIPVPLTKKRFTTRGYNQAQLLAEEVSKLLKTESDSKDIKVEMSALERVKQTEKQQDMTAKKRAENMKDAFCVTDAGLVRGKSILLVDDVFTTGSTVNECARILKAAGAESVYVLTIANTELKPTEK